MLNSQRLERLGTGVFSRNDFRKQAYRQKSLETDSYPLFDLSLGSSDLLPPPVVIEAMRSALGKSCSSSYCLHAATQPFREAAARWIEGRLGVKVDSEEEILLLVGSQEGTAHLPLAVLDAGQSGLILDPSYPSHRAGLVLADANIETLMLNSDQGWKPDLNSLSMSQWDELRLMIFGFPHNPTAQVGEQNLLDEVMERGRQHQVVIAHDNPYLDLALDGQAPSLLKCEGWRECGIEFFSCSKGWCMGGFRLAFAVGSKSIVSALRKVKAVVDFNQSLAIQAGGIAAFSEANNWPASILEIYRERRDRTISKLLKLGWPVEIPSMAMYLWMPLPEWAKGRGLSDEAFAADLLADTGIALTPGSGFGLGGTGWLRLALVRKIDEIEAAVDRMSPWWNANS